MQFFRKRAKKQQKRPKYLKILGKGTKFENIGKKANLMCATIESMKQLEYALVLPSSHLLA